MPKARNRAARRFSPSGSTGDRKMVAFYVDVRTDHDLSIPAAIVHQQIEFWMQHATKKHDGHDWIYKSYPELAKDTTLTYDQVRKAMRELLAKSMIEQIHNPLRGNDRTYWYRLVDSRICGETLVTSDAAQMNRAGAQMDAAHSPDGSVAEHRSTVAGRRTIPVETSIETSISNSLTEAVDEAVGRAEGDESGCEVGRSQMRSRRINRPDNKTTDRPQPERQSSSVIAMAKESTPAKRKLEDLRRRNAEARGSEAGNGVTPLNPALEEV